MHYLRLNRKRVKVMAYLPRGLSQRLSVLEASLAELRDQVEELISAEDDEEDDEADEKEDGHEDDDDEYDE